MNEKKMFLISNMVIHNEKLLYKRKVYVTKGQGMSSDFLTITASRCSHQRK